MEDDCAICLEAPHVGAVVRHLPCMHKLHRDVKVSSYSVLHF
jgi:hypothetical protein